MKHKRGITLSVNFLVVIILALVILSFSVYFLIGVVSRAKGLGETTQADLNKKIENIQCEGVVCVPINYKKIEAGEFEIFGVKIYNDGSDGVFKLMVNAVKEDIIPYKPDKMNVTLRANEEKRIGIGFDVQKGTPAGLYIYNVKVSDPSGDDYGTTQQIRIEVP